MTDYHQAPAEAAPVGCTCHPDDNPPQPCPRRHALSECRRADLSRKASLFMEGAKNLYEDRSKSTNGDMWFFELFHFLDDVTTELKK